MKQIKKMRMRVLTLLVLLISVTVNAQTVIKESEKNDIKLTAVAELGYLAVMNHTIQFGNNGTDLNYVTQGGQDVLFPVSRLSLELGLGKKNTLVFLYQPLKIESQALLESDLIVDNEVFPAGTGVNFLYNFPFYRLSYLRELMSENDKYKFAVGLTAQIRNATISFESQDGSKFRRNADIGFVPALKIKSTANFTERIYGEIEADGIYAPVSYLNGADNEIVGAILDASLRVGYRLDGPVRAFANLRYLGGGAVGTDPDDEGPGDGYTKNWLNFLTVSAGFAYDFQ
jgi:hypothetical protein